MFNLGKKSGSGTNGLFGDAFSGLGLLGVQTQNAISFQKDRLEFASNLSKSASALRNSLNTLNAALAKPLMKSAFSGNEGVLTASSSLMASAIKREPMNVEVTQLATAQTMKGNLLDSKEKMGTGALNFSIQVGDKTKSFSLSVMPEDTNKSVFGNMAEAINGAKLGVTATVVNSGGKSSLQIVSDEAGTAASSKFSLGAVTLAGEDITDKLGLTEANTTEAVGSKYIVDGKEASAESNKVSLDFGVDVTFKSTGEAEIGYKTNTDAVTNAVAGFINSFNALNTLLGDKSSTFKGAASLDKEFDGLMGNSYRTLNRIGISIGSGGTLSVDKTTMEEAVSDGGMKSLFGGYGSLGSQLAQKAGKIISNPTSFAVQANQFKMYSSAGTYSSLFGFMGLSGSIFNAYL